MFLINGRRAFTLVELLTVVAVIAILAAILIPLVGSVRDRANSSKSVSNLRQIGVIVQTYANENNGRYPQCQWWGDGSTNWYNFVHNELRGVNLEFHNRAKTPLEDTILWSPLEDYTNVSTHHAYGFNWVMTKMGSLDKENEWVGPQGPLMVNFDTPNQTVMVMDADTHNGILGWGDGVAYRNPGHTANMVFFDGHVEARTRDRVPENWKIIVVVQHFWWIGS